MTRTVALALAAMGLVLGTAQARADDPALALARKLTDAGAATFNNLNAKTMAAYYTEDAKLTVESREGEQVTLKEHVGHDEIEQFYYDLFENREPGTIVSRNHVEYARLLADDVLVIAGVFEPNTRDEKSLKVPFYQVRVKHGDKWLITSMRIFIVGKPES